MLLVPHSRELAILNPLQEVEESDNNVQDDSAQNQPHSERQYLSNRTILFGIFLVRVTGWSFFHNSIWFNISNNCHFFIIISLYS